jgi:hypothetical protein
MVREMFSSDTVGLVADFTKHAAIGSILYDPAYDQCIIARQAEPTKASWGCLVSSLIR